MKSEYSERFKLECYNRIQQEQAHQLYKDWIAPDLPALAHHRDPAREPVLRRLVRRQLREPRPVRRRDHLRADSATSRRRSAASASRWARFMYGGSTGGGRRWRADPLSGRVQRRVRRLPGPDRLPRVHDGQHLQGRERLLLEGPVEAAPRPGHRDYLGHVSTTVDRHEPARARRSGRRAARAASGTSGRRSTPRSAPTATRSASGTSAPASSTSRSPSTGARTTTSRTSCGATGTKGLGAEARAARSTSTSATWTTTT